MYFIFIYPGKDYFPDYYSMATALLVPTTFILLYIPLFILQILRIYEYKKPNQEVNIFFSTEEALKISLDFLLGSYNVSVLLNGEERKNEKFFLYKCVAMTNQAENGEALKDEGQIMELDDQTTSKLLLPMNKPKELRIGSKTISFSLRYTDPENPRIYQKPKELLIFIKDLSLLQGASIKIK